MAMKLGNNLLNLIGRTQAPYDGKSSNSTVRSLSEKYYYIGLTDTNYWVESNIDSYLITENKVQINSKKEGYGVTFPVRCKPNEKYKLSFTGENTNYVIGYYTANGEWISKRNGNHIENLDGGYFTTPENCYWFTVCLMPPDISQIATFTNIMLNEGTTALPYEPYRPSNYAMFMKGGYNLLKIKGRTQAPYDSSAGANTSIRNFSEDYYYVGMTANNYWYYWYVEQYLVEENKVQLQSTSAAYGIGVPVKCNPNTNYSISFIGENRVHISVGFYTRNGELISWTPDSAIGDKGGFFTTPENCYWISICFKSIDSTQIGTFINIMLNEGITALPYSPFGRTKVRVAYEAGKNLFDISKLKNDDNPNFKNNGDGSFTVTGYNATIYVHLTDLAPRLKAGKTYTLSLKTESTNNFIYLYGGGFGVWKSGQSIVVTDEILNGIFNVYGYSNESENANQPCRVWDFGIYEGETELPYEPYQPLKKANMLVL